MTIKSLSGAIGLIGAVGALLLGAQQYVSAQVSEAEEKSKRAVSFVQAAHRLDVYEGKQDEAKMKLDLLRRIGAEQHEIDAAESEVEFWRDQALKAREEVAQ